MKLWNRSKNREGFPPDFAVQKIESTEARAIARLPALAIAEFFQQNPGVAQKLITESSDKRFSPSTFLTQEGDEYRVGWFSRAAGYQCERRFATLADAATDYLLFSIGEARWTPPDA